MGRVLAAVRKVWLVGGFSLLCLVAADLLLRALLTAPGDPAGPRAAKRVADTYRGAPWVDQLYDEYYESFVMRWEPYAYWRHAAYEGEYIHVGPDGLRRTWNAPRGPGREPMRIFMFGGSTLWGTGARDDHTIPSEVSRLLDEAGYRVEVTNFGQSGYVSTQEVIALCRELQRGNLPDLVVFYDGVNESVSAYQNRRGGLPQNEWRRAAEFNLLRRPGRMLVELARHSLEGFLRLAKRLAPARDAAPRLPEDVSARVIDEALRLYNANLRLVEELGAAHGFESLFYWQPVIYTKESLTDYERQESVRHPEALRAFVVDLYAAAADDPHLRAHPGFADVSGIFGDSAEPFYVDFAHLGEEGNRVVARRIALDLTRLRGGPGRPGQAPLTPPIGRSDH